LVEELSAIERALVAALVSALVRQLKLERGAAS